MLTGRNAKLDALEKLYARQNFQLVVLYGAGKTGKTALCSAFAKDKPAIYFSAARLNGHMNLEAFSRLVYDYAGEEYLTPFGNWLDAFRYISKLAEKGRLLLIMDNFHHLVGEDKNLLFAMQRAVDSQWKMSNLYVILSTGRVAFAESELMGEASPLAGRRTSQIKLDGLDFMDAAKLLEGFSSEDKLRIYCTVGGTPEFLLRMDREKSFEENIKAQFFCTGGPLFSRVPEIFLGELREPAVYNSILASLARGKVRLGDISTETAEDSTKVNKYMQTLLRMQVVTRDTPFGENADSCRKGVYSITDNSLAFWFRFVLPNIRAIEEGKDIFPEGELTGIIDEYIAGKPFENVCYQYLCRKNRLGDLPFLGSQTGKWWSSSKTANESELVVASLRTRQILFASYLWNGEYEPEETLKALEKKKQRFPEYWERFNCLFSRAPFRRELRNSASEALMLVDLDKLFE